MCAPSAVPDVAAAADVLNFTPGMKQSKVAVLMTQEDMEEEQRLVSSGCPMVSLHANTPCSILCAVCMDRTAAQSSQS